MTVFINLQNIASFFAEKMPDKIKCIMRFALLLGLLVNAFAVRNLIVEKPLNSSQINDWKKAYHIMDIYRNKGEMLVSPHLSAYSLEHNIPVADYGQAEFNSTSNLNRFKNNYICSIFPEAERILLKNIEYYRQIKEKVKNREYALIALTNMGKYSLTEEEIETSGYKKVEEIILVTGIQKWKTKFYIADNL